jgi:hypothetical protein
MGLYGSLTMEFGFLNMANGENLMAKKQYCFQYNQRIKCTSCEHFRSCIFGDGPCPIALVQSIYNYDACNNKLATDILVKNDGTCIMKKEFRKTLHTDAKQKSLF